jgi:hypothetical protein
MATKETKKITAGQTIWYYHVRSNKILIETVVTKVGNKYFEIEIDDISYKFNIDNLRQPVFSVNIEIVLNKEEFDTQIKTDHLLSKLRKEIAPYGKSNIPLDKLIKMVEILES